MICPVCAHKDPDSAYGVTIPDFPGCFAAADELEALPRMIQEAVEGHFEGEEGDIPLPSPVEAFLGAPEYEGGLLGAPAGGPHGATACATVCPASTRTPTTAT